MRCKMLFVCKIHNMTLGSCFSVDSWSEGCDLVIKLATEQGFELSESDKENIQNSGEFYNNDDPDNHYTFSIASPEIY